MTPDPTPAVSPFTVVVDTREQAPFTFLNFTRDASDGGGPLLVRTIRGTLRSGDYSVLGHEHEVAVERKGISDLFGSVGAGRARFERELARLAEMPFALVVVEAGWPEVLTDPPPHTRLPAKTVFRSVVAWRQRYPTVHWDMSGSRRLAEVMTFRTLERFWRVRQQALKAKESP